MQERNQPIGVFDSGIGGLTVLEQLIKELPNEKFIYVADKGHCPYGTKTSAQISARVQKITSFLLEKQVKAIVVACNTSSVHIQAATSLTNKPVISVIQPTCARAMQVTRNKRVAVLATLSTIRSGIYQRLLKRAGIVSLPLACGEFVDFLENCDISDPTGDRIVGDKLRPLRCSGIDVLIHGCTHFPLLEPRMRKILDSSITYVASGAPTAEYLEKILAQNNLLNAQACKGNVIIFTTGNADRVADSMKWFKANHSPVQHIDID